MSSQHGTIVMPSDRAPLIERNSVFPDCRGVPSPVRGKRPHRGPGTVELSFRRCPTRELLRDHITGRAGLKALIPGVDVLDGAALSRTMAGGWRYGPLTGWVSPARMVLKELPFVRQSSGWTIAPPSKAKSRLTGRGLTPTDRMPAENSPNNSDLVRRWVACPYEPNSVVNIERDGGTG